METFDFVIIGAGPAGEAAANEARALGASVAVIDRLWFGGSCPHIGCLPSKSLLHGAAEHAANHSAYSWTRASERRDYMINRPAGAEEPDDSSHVKALEAIGAVCYRGSGRIVGHGKVEIRHDDRAHEIAGSNVMVAVGSTAKVPPLPGLDGVRIWTNREATLTRERPKSLVVLGGGPTGCELSQVYVRFGVPTTIVQSGDRLMPTEHPRNSETVAKLLRRDGVNVRLGVRARAARAGAGADGADVDDAAVGRGDGAASGTRQAADELHVRVEHARRHVRARRMASACSVPPQHLLAPRVEQADDQDEDEDGHLHESVPAERSEQHGPREQEDDLDVEHHEQQGEDVEVAGVAAPCLPDRLLTGFVGARLLERRLSRGDEPRNAEQYGDEAGTHEEKGKDIEIREVVVGHFDVAYERPNIAANRGEFARSRAPMVPVGVTT